MKVKDSETRKTKTQKEENLVLPKKYVENTDLYKPVLNKIMTICEWYMKYNFVAPLNKFFLHLLYNWISRKSGYEWDHSHKKQKISVSCDYDETEIIEFSVPMWVDVNYITMKQFSEITSIVKAFYLNS